MQTTISKTHTHTLIISDVHLGSIISRAEALKDLLSNFEFKRLILLGDFFDNSNFKRLSKSHWKLLSTIQTFSEPESGKEIIWIRGNHDGKTADTMAHMIGAKVCDEYVWELAGKKYLALHGDKFAQTFFFNDFLAMIGHNFFRFFQYFDRKGRHIVRFFDRLHANLRRLSGRVSSAAIKYAKQSGAQYVFCGHTHKPMYKVQNDNDKAIHYYNTGCWTQTPSTFVTIAENGDVSLQSYT